MTKVEEKPFVFPSLKKPVPETSSAIVTPANGKRTSCLNSSWFLGLHLQWTFFLRRHRKCHRLLPHPFPPDHYKGLSNKLFIDGSRPGTRLYCPEVTGNLVKKELRIRGWIHYDIKDWANLHYRRNSRWSSWCQPVIRRDVLCFYPSFFNSTSTIL